MLLLLTSASLVLLPSPATADCSGPTILRIEPAVRGETVTVQGRAFGNKCYDTEPPPAGEGALGVPVSGIELFVAQGDDEVLVARGAVDVDYEFSVDIVVPPHLLPGPARVMARWGTDQSTEQALEVLADPPVAEPSGTAPIVQFGPAPSTLPVTEPEDTNTSGARRNVEPVTDDDDGGVAGVAAGGVLVVVLIGAIGAVWWSHRRKALN